MRTWNRAGRQAAWRTIGSMLLLPAHTRAGQAKEQAGAAVAVKANTNWDLFEHPASKRPCLPNDTQWLEAPALEGPWTSVRVLPHSFGRLPADDNWKDVREAIPARGASAAPMVFVSTTPAELILVRGMPQYSGLDRSAVGTTGRDQARDFARPDSTTVGQLDHNRSSRLDGGQRGGRR